MYKVNVNDRVIVTKVMCCSDRQLESVGTMFTITEIVEFNDGQKFLRDLLEVANPCRCGNKDFKPNVFAIGIPEKEIEGIERHTVPLECIEKVPTLPQQQ